MLKENRAIVTPHPGTTRDYLEEWLSLQGYPLRLLDTAGLRQADNLAEQIGIDRANELMESADLILYLTDAQSVKDDSALVRLAANPKTLFIFNKIDLLDFDALPSPAGFNQELSKRIDLPAETSSIRFIPCSAVSEQGSQALEQQILSRIALPENQIASGLITNVRHLAAIQKAMQSLQHALSSLKRQDGYEFTAFDLIEAVSALSEITGAVTTDEMLERIFAGFCIGK